MEMPLGLAQVARNVRYTAQSVAGRFGHSTRIQISQGHAITAVSLLRYLAAQPGTLNLSAVETVLLMAYDQAGGNIYSVAPFLQNTLIQLTSAAFLAQSGFTSASLQGLNPVMTQGFNMGFFALGDLLLPKQGPLVYVPLPNALYPASDLPFGAAWTPGTYYRVGQMVSPSTFQSFGQQGGQGTWVEQQTGFLYRCKVPGTSAVYPANGNPLWPQTYDGTVVDGQVTWEEYTPIFCSGLPDPAAPTFVSAAPNLASPITPGAHVYACCTYLNPVGEGVNQIVSLKGVVDTKKVLLYTNNTA